MQQPERYNSSLPRSPPPQMAVLFCSVPGQVSHLKGWWTKFLADDLDMFYMYAEMANVEHTETQLRFSDLPNPSLFITTPKVGWRGHNPTAAYHAVITQKFWVWNEQCQAFARVIRLGQNRVPQTWLLNAGPSGYDNRVSDLHQLSGVAQVRVRHGLMSWPNTMTSMIYCILECWEAHAQHIVEHRDVMSSHGEDPW